MILPKSSEPGGSLVLEKGDLAGQRFRFTLRVCSNPVCNCQLITLCCRPEQSEPSDSVSAMEVDFNLPKHEVASPKEAALDGKAEALAKAVANEIEASDWKGLRRMYVSLKQHYTEHADLELVEADFSPEIADGGMAGYYEILPFARPIELGVDGRQWLFDDQYCVQPRCHCTHTIISFPQAFKVNDNEATTRGKPGLVIDFDYHTGRVQRLPESMDGELKEQDFIAALKELQPDLKGFFAQRHAALRLLYRRSLDRSRFRRTSPKTGRNDPCPCGSGKKFKHCCARN